MDKGQNWVVVGVLFFTVTVELPILFPIHTKSPSSSPLYRQLGILQITVQQIFSTPADRRRRCCDNHDYQFCKSTACGICYPCLRPKSKQVCKKRLVKICILIWFYVKITCSGIVGNLVMFSLDLTSLLRPNRIHILFSTQANFMIMWQTFSTWYGSVW